VPEDINRAILFFLAFSWQKSLFLFDLDINRIGVAIWIVAIV